MIRNSVFIPDQPADRDFLDFDLYVSALIDQLSSPKTETPMTIGIYGTWGSGKTTLMKLIDNRLDEQRKTRSLRIETLWVNVWQLSNQKELSVAFLQSIFSQVHKRLPFWRKRRFDWQLIQERINTGELIRQIVTNSYRVILVMIPFLVVALWPLQDQHSLPPTHISELLNLIFSPVTGGLTSLVLFLALLVKPVVEAAKDKVSIDLKKILKDPTFEIQITALQALQNQFERMINEWVGHSGRAIVFVDDLDRCSPDKIAEVLEALKMFATTRGCIYVLGVDHHIVARAIQTKYKEFTGSLNNELHLEGVRYLEKIIQLPFLLPLVEISDITRYLNSFNVDWPHQGILDSFSRGLPPNPRLIKRAVNIYLLLYRLAEHRKLQKKVGGAITPLRLAKIVALQTVYPDSFETLRDRPDILKTIEDFCYKSVEEQREWLQAPDSDPIISDLVKRPYIVDLLFQYASAKLCTFSARL